MTAKRMAGNWFNVNNGVYSGVVIPEHVMKKLVKLYAKHNDEVKDLLTQHKDEIYPYEWSLAYPNGEQKTVVYNSAYSSVEERIEFLKNCPPIEVDESAIWELRRISVL